jgi:hypothetical protein
VLVVNTNVSIPLSFLRDIAVLLDAFSFEELVGRSHKRGRNPNAEYALALWELKMTLHKLGVADIYVKAFDDVADDEMRQLCDWVAKGHSVFSNPCYICDDKGLQVDFINGCRADDEMREDLPDHLWGEPDQFADDDLPF